MTAVIKNYSDLGTYINSILTANGDSPVGGPHAQFWDTLTYNEFISGNVPGVADATTMQPWKILVVGNSAASNLILALSGATGTVFAPGATPGQMPRFGTPFTDVQIQPIAAWIDAKCPNPSAAIS
jgi:hypothetical protein